MPEDQPTQRNIVPAATAFEAGLTLLAITLGWLCGVKPLETLSWNPRDLAWGALASVPLFVGLYLMVRFPRGPIRELLRIVDDLVLTIFHKATLFDLALIAVMAGLGEETLFRGFVQTALAKWTNSIAVGLVGSALLFGLVHSVTRAYAVIAAVVGAYLGWLWLATGNLLAPITAHAIYDFGALWYMSRTIESRTPASGD